VPSQSHRDDTVDDVRARYRGWHVPIPALLAATRPETLLHHAIYYIKARLPRYHTGRVVLLGDAAHAMTPDIGQGGCQALEDAVTLVHLLAKHDVPAALAAFDRARRERTQKIVRTSAIWGTISEWRNPVAATIRNALVRLLPPSAFLNASRQTLGWQPPHERLAA